MPASKTTGNLGDPPQADRAAALINTARTLRALLPREKQASDPLSLLLDQPLQADPSTTLDQWFLWLISGPDTPLAPWRDHHLAVKTTNVLQKWLSEGDIHPHIWLDPSHHVRQLIKKHSDTPISDLDHITMANLHFANVLRSILLYIGARAIQDSSNHQWTSSWTAYGEDPEVHTAYSAGAGSDVANNTMLAVFTYNQNRPAPLIDADQAVSSMARHLTDIAPTGRAVSPAWYNFLKRSHPTGREHIDRSEESL